ncbi:HEAT repeat-containing protein 6 [Anthonomus grandis grandis]|uniref:HEAT repeat-containing protein 6 n=1 Tax=Anthonomus grandis grandis TaxID=2921223 RepID=UPI002165C06A|nr:HEAT repeat-containing protein 6 [Anthonomus grandis grandis]
MIPTKNVMDPATHFDHLSQKIGQILYGRSDRNHITKYLDDLLLLNYRFPIIRSPTKAVLLINQFCSSVHSDEEILVGKFAQLTAILIKTQNVVVEGRTLILAVQWCLQALKCSEVKIVLDVLNALEALLRNNCHNLLTLSDTIFKGLAALTVSENAEITLASLQCLEASTAAPSNSEPLDSLMPFFDKCIKVFFTHLCVKTTPKYTVLEAKILETCLIGLQNIVTITECFKDKLGTLLGIVKTYMLFNIKGVDFLSFEKLMPTTLSIPEITPSMPKEKTGGKVTKQRKHRTTGTNRKKDKKLQEDQVFDNRAAGYTPATKGLDYNSDSGLGHKSPYIARLKTSDSDFSDNEGGRLAKFSHACNRVRQAALNLFSCIIKHTEKPVIFSYWSSFVPESSSSGKHNLLTCIHRDPSIRGKMTALNALLMLLTSSKAYLSQAELKDKPSSFTPFSELLALTLIEVHNNLCLALNQTSAPVLAQVLKCLAALVQATPYHKIPAGLITKIVRHIKTLVCHRDATVQVTALIVAGCILAYEPPVPEITQVMTKVQKEEETPKKKLQNHVPVEEFDYAQFSSDEEETVVMEIDSIPWLLQRCLRNLGISFEELDSQGVAVKPVPAPVKLESLQVLSAMSRNYFDSIMLPHLNYITKALNVSLMDKYVDLRLHAGRAVDFVGQSISKTCEKEAPTTSCINFWLVLLDNPLVALIQNDQQAALRAVGCDCFGSIGAEIFQQFPREKQILCVTLLFAATKDEESTVRGAAVRALALCVLYPSLRDDPGFVVDTAESVLQALKDDNLNVRIKASWSLGNLSDALVLNSKKLCDNNEDSIPDKVLLRLLEASICCANDNDKIKVNNVRACGNLLQLVDDILLEKECFKDASSQAMNSLIQASTVGFNMKVRWNACYALANVLKNEHLYSKLDAFTWQQSVFTKLTELVVTFKNFKVRINAALALSAPTKREHYGQCFESVWTGMLQALENSHNIDDFTEYKHRDHLVEQICLCLGHLTTLITREDLSHLDGTLSLYLDTFKMHMRKVIERLVPEKSTDLFAASCTLSKLEADVRLGVNERTVLDRLKSVFAYD